MPPGHRGALSSLDPELFENLHGKRRVAAEKDVFVRLERLDPGMWRPSTEEFGAHGGIGLLIVEGFMLRRVQLGHRAAGEVLGPGDLLRPWQDDGEHAVYPFSVGWRVLQPASLAVLDRAFTIRLARYPEVTAALVGRAMARSRRVSGHLVLAQLGSVRDRILLVLWHMADQWGRVRMDGIVLPICLTHEMLGLIVGARRPAVTTALRELARRGLVVHDANAFRLCGDPPAQLDLLRGR